LLRQSLQFNPESICCFLPPTIEWNRSQHSSNVSPIQTERSTDDSRDDSKTRSPHQPRHSALQIRGAPEGLFNFRYLNMFLKQTLKLHKIIWPLTTLQSVISSLNNTSKVRFLNSKERFSCKWPTPISIASYPSY
jgi:hypothetical protein